MKKIKGLYHVQLNGEGEVISEPTRLSLPESDADWGRMVINARNEVQVFWSDDFRGRPGLYHLTVDSQGTIASPNSLVVPKGVSPSLQVDEEGLIHLAWFERVSHNERGVYYATFFHLKVATSRRLQKPEGG